MKNKNVEDDNRVIADMSMIEKPTLMGTFFGRRFDVKTKTEEKPVDISKEDRRLYMLAAMKAGLAIGLVYVVVIGLVIAGMILVWKLHS